MRVCAKILKRALREEAKRIKKLTYSYLEKLLAEETVSTSSASSVRSDLTVNFESLQDILHPEEPPTTPDVAATDDAWLFWIAFIIVIMLCMLCT